MKARYVVLAITAVLGIGLVRFFTVTPSFDKVVPQLTRELNAAKIDVLTTGAKITGRKSMECSSTKTGFDRRTNFGDKSTGSAEIRVDFSTSRTIQDLSESFRSDAKRLGFTEPGEIMGRKLTDDRWAENWYRTDARQRRTYIFLVLSNRIAPGTGYMLMYIPCDDLQQ
jgi:hypothetical protein